MAMAVYSSYKTNEGSVSYPRDASFSSYLDANEQDFVQNLAQTIHSISPPPHASSPQVSIGRNRIPRCELGVFGAERYFNDKLDEKKSAIPTKDGDGRNKSRHRRERRDDVLEKKSCRSIRGTTSSSLKSPTPSLRSEGSWNSQIGLLTLKKASGGLRIFQCKGSCFDKKSVHTANTNHQASQSPSPNKYYQANGHRKNNRLSHEHFAFPIIDTASPHHTYRKSPKLDDLPRKSVEVFGLHHLGKQDIELNLERKLSILAWDAIPSNSPNNSLPFPIPNTKKSISTQRDDDDLDLRSEASSDLFEIENLSGLGKGSIISQTSDVSICMTPQTNYGAPSEASIEWSVVTASAADFSMFLKI